MNNHASMFIGRSCQAHRGLPVGFLLLQYSVLFTVESLCVGETTNIWPFLKYNVLRGPKGAE